MNQRYVASVLTCGMLFAGSCHAANLQLWGVVDGFVQVVDNGASTTATAGTNGYRSTKFGLRGSEDLGAGWSAFFELESGIRLDTGRNAFPSGDRIFDGQALVGLRGRWGQLSVGQQYIPHWGAIAMVDPTDMSMGSAINYFAVPFDLGKLSARSNSLMFVSAPAGGFIAAAAVTLGERNRRFMDPANEEENLYNVAISYMHGPALVNLSYLEQETNEQGNVDRYYVASAAYDFGFIKPSFIYVRRTASQPKSGSSAWITDLNADAFQVGAILPAWGGSFITTAGVLRNRTEPGSGASAWGVKYAYPLSKRTTIYAGITGLNNDGNAAFVISPGGPSEGIPTPAGANSKSAYFGLSQNF